MNLLKVTTNIKLNEQRDHIQGAGLFAMVQRSGYKGGAGRLLRRAGLHGYQTVWFYPLGEHA